MEYYNFLSEKWKWLWTHQPAVLNDGHESVKKNDGYEKKIRSIHYIKVTSALSLFPPFADLTTFIIIALQCLWTYLFIWLEIGEGISYDVSIVVGILSATLGFILPLQLNSALSKNANCLDNYNACTGDLIALCWDIVAFYSKSEYGAENDINVQRSLNVIGAMPALIKHSFRGTIDLSKATTVSGPSGSKFSHVEGGKTVYNMFIKLKGNGMSEVDLCFYKLLDYIKDLTIEENQKTRTFLVKSWERAYGSWGNMSNLNAYHPPTIFTYVLNMALALYILLLPYTLSGQGYHAVWMVAIIGYFFLGLNMAGKKVANAFTEGAVGFQTVSNSQKTASCAIQQIYNTIGDVVGDDDEVSSVKTDLKSRFRLKY